MAPPAAVNIHHSHSYLTDSLPQEIRDKIYEYVLVFDVNLFRPVWDLFDSHGRGLKQVPVAKFSEQEWMDLEDIINWRDRDNRKTVPIDLLLVNRRINTEATRIFFGKNMFTLNTVHLLAYHSASPIFNPAELFLMTNIKLMLPLASFSTRREHPPLNDYVIELFVKSLKGRANIKKLEVVVSQSRQAIVGCDMKFQKAMGSFAKLRNIKSVAFILRNVVPYEDIPKSPAWAFIAFAFTSQSIENIEPFLNKLAKQMTAPASVGDWDPDIVADSEDGLSIKTETLQLPEPDSPDLYIGTTRRTVALAVYFTLKAA